MKARMKCLTRSFAGFLLLLLLVVSPERAEAGEWACGVELHKDVDHTNTGQDVEGSYGVYGSHRSTEGNVNGTPLRDDAVSLV